MLSWSILQLWRFSAPVPKRLKGRCTSPAPTSSVTPISTKNQSKQKSSVTSWPVKTLNPAHPTKFPMTSQKLRSKDTQVKTMNMSLSISCESTRQANGKGTSTLEEKFMQMLLRHWLAHFTMPKENCRTARSSCMHSKYSRHHLWMLT